MKSFYLTAVIDAVFTSIASFIMLLILFSYFIPHPYNVILSGVIALLLSLFAFKHQVKKGKKRGDNIILNKKYIDTMTQFCLTPTTELLDLMEKLIKKENLSVERKRGGLFIKDKKVFIFIKFTFDGINKTDVVKYFNRITQKEKAVILSNEFSVSVREFADRFNGKVILIDGRLIFERLTHHQMLPENKYTILNKQVAKPKILTNLNNKKRAKSFFTFGLIFLGMSYFAPIKIYYLIVGGLMLIFSLVLRLYGKTEYTA